jgi:hypothetical protein
MTVLLSFFTSKLVITHYLYWPVIRTSTTGSPYGGAHVHARG